MALQIPLKALSTGWKSCKSIAAASSACLKKEEARGKKQEKCIEIQRSILMVTPWF